VSYIFRRIPVTDNTPVKQSPIYSEALKMGARFTEGAGWQIPSLFSMLESEIAAARTHVALADVSDRGKIFVEGQTAESILSLPKSLAVGEGLEQDGRTIFRLRADQFFVSTTADAVEAVTAELTAAAHNAAGLVTVTDMTHGRSQLLVVGPNAAVLLGRLCGLDFHDSQFPNLSARQSSVAKTRQLILRQDYGGQDIGSLRVYSLIGSRSLAVYLWKTTLEAGEDLFILPVGQETIDALK
jgi:heterotetrameric sarcosine oxidase gamma subunit